MKIGILTLSLKNNYGGILQAWALQTYLERIGHQVEVLNTPLRDISTNWKQVPKRLIKKILGYDEVIFREKKNNREFPIINKSIMEFRSQYIHERIISSFLEIEESDYDCIIVGSDQVWRPKYFKDQYNQGIENAYLSFTKGWGIKRISYAASFGVDKWEYSPDETKSCKESSQSFNFISVREDSGITLVNEYLQNNAISVLDPTFLLEKEDYIKLIEKTPKSAGSLLTYFLDSNREKVELVRRVEKDKKLIAFSVNNSLVDTGAPVADRILPSIEQWLRGFYDAEFVITDSFHACVFSIIFEKPFICIGNITRGLSRFTSILQKVNGISNLIDTFRYDPYLSYTIDKTLLEKNIIESREFLEYSLKS